MENIELYLIVVLLLAIVALIADTIRYYNAQKRKVKNLHRFAKDGEMEAQEDLARHYEEGKIVRQDRQKAAFWYQKASFSAAKKEQNDSNAKNS